MTAIRAVIAVYESCPAYRYVRIGRLKQLPSLFGFFACSACTVLTRLCLQRLDRLDASCSGLLQRPASARPPRRDAPASALRGACEELDRIRPRLPER